MTRLSKSVALMALAWAMTGVAARAQDAAAAAPEETPFVTFSGYAAFVTDYRFRGVSLSDRDIAGQGTIVATTKPGFFVSIWGSTIQNVGVIVDEDDVIIDDGSTQEIDLTGGWSKAFGNITPTVGAIGYIYPGAKNINYYEVFGSVAGTFGPVTITGGVNYAPDQGNTFEDNFYVYGLAAFGIPNVPITIKGSVGYEDGAFDFNGSRGKVDWMIGADFKYKFITVGVQYIDTDLGDDSFAFRRNRKGGVVGSITASF